MQVVPVEEQPAPVSGVVVGVVTEQPGAADGHDGYRGSIEALGRWREEKKKPRDARQVSGPRRWNR